MERDSRKGFGHWTGCHTFKDIICDGDVDASSVSKRDGGLKQGGTYWYYVCLLRAGEDFRANFSVVPIGRRRRIFQPSPAYNHFMSIPAWAKA